MAGNRPMMVMRSPFPRFGALARPGPRRPPGQRGEIAMAPDQRMPFEPENQDQIESIVAIIERKMRDASDHIGRLDALMSKHGFLTNAGGAAATLAFIGTAQEKAALGTLPLAIFVIGIIASGVEIRALMNYFGKMQTYLIEARIRVVEGRLAAYEEILVPKDLGSADRKWNHGAGIVAQGAFIVGAMMGVTGLSWTFLSSGFCLSN